jgi:hypothetical protein
MPPRLVLLRKVLHAAEQDRPDVAAMRRRWRRGQRKLDAKRLIFIDETAISTGMTRRGGRSPRGERLICKVRFGSWQTVTLVAALRHDRVSAPMLREGAMTGECFRTGVGADVAARRHCGDGQRAAAPEARCARGAAGAGCNRA